MSTVTFVKGLNCCRLFYACTWSSSSLHAWECQSWYCRV